MKVWGVMLLMVLAAMLAGCGASPAAVPAAQAAAIDVVNLPDTVDAKTVAALMGRDDVVVLDVREPAEYAEGHLPNVTLIPMNSVPDRLSEIPKDKTVILTCRSGNRSGQVADFLRKQGYEDVHNMQGGILAWQSAGLPVEK